MLATDDERESGICHECAAGQSEGYACDREGKAVGPDEFVLIDRAIFTCPSCGHQEDVLVYQERCPKCGGSA